MFHQLEKLSRMGRDDLLVRRRARAIRGERTRADEQ
jgi:hypothetical protein